MNINDLTIGQAKEISSMFSNLNTNTNAVPTNLDDFCIGKCVIIRTFSAGVWCGTLKQKAGKEVILENARRMWKWWCRKSISLSGVAIYGINREKSKITAPVPLVWLEAIEIIPISGEARESIMEAEIVEAE